MSDHNLRNLLEELQNEIDNAKSRDDKGRSLLRELSSAIGDYLGSSDEGRKEAGETLRERLKDSIDHFEITHPTLTMMLSQASTILSNAGI